MRSIQRDIEQALAGLPGVGFAPFPGGQVKAVWQDGPERRSALFETRGELVSITVAVCPDHLVSPRRVLAEAARLKSGSVGLVRSTFVLHLCVPASRMEAA